MKSIQEQEHWDFEAGRASEFQNCFEEANMVRARLHAEQSAIIKGALDEGKFVVVRDVPYYCKTTDACAGSVRYFERCFDFRAAADLFCEQNHEDDSQLFVLPALPQDLPNWGCRVADSGVPF